MNDEIIERAQLSGRAQITFSLTSCSNYSDRRRASLSAKESIAWMLRSDPKRNTIGFGEPSELTRFIVTDDWDDYSGPLHRHVSTFGHDHQLERSPFCAVDVDDLLAVGMNHKLAAAALL